MFKAKADAATELSKACEVTRTLNEHKGQENSNVPDREEGTRPGQEMSFSTAQVTSPTPKKTQAGKRRLKTKKRETSMFIKSKDSCAKENTIIDESMQMEVDYRKAKNDVPAEEQIIYLGQRLHYSDILSSRKTQRDGALLLAPKLNLQELTRLPGPAIDHTHAHSAPVKE